MDIEFQTSSRFLAKYVLNHEYEIKDHVQGLIKAYDPKFILTEEGKKIILDKVKVDVNKFLKAKKVPGKIESVYIAKLIAG